MGRFVTRLVCILGAFSVLYQPAVAENVIQEFRDEHHSSQYAQVKGWTVYRLHHSYSDDLGCGAVKYGKSGQFIIERTDDWQIIVPAQQQADETFAGGVLSIDKYEFDSQFATHHSFATKILTPTELNYLKNGSNVGVTINGRRALSWSLHGSAAALLKVKECVKQKSAKALAQNNSPIDQPSQAQPIHQQPLGIYVDDCNTYTTGLYRCNLEELAPEQGYARVFLVKPDSFSGAPGYFFRVYGDGAADVWVSFDGEPWRFVGYWIPASGGRECWEPSGTHQQTTEAIDNMGQDAWNFCFH